MYFMVSILLFSVLIIFNSVASLPHFDSVQLLNSTVNGFDNKTCDVVVEARGKNLREILAIKFTTFDSSCEKTLDLTFNLSSSSSSASDDNKNDTKDEKIISEIHDVPYRKLYFCLKTDEGTDVWQHQGDNVYLDLKSNLTKSIKRQLDDLSEYSKTCLNDQKLQIVGLRYENWKTGGEKSPDFDKNGVPALLINNNYTLRLFGFGFTNEVYIAFTKVEERLGQKCSFLTDTDEIFPISVRQDGDVTATVTVQFKEVEETLYICTAKSSNISASLFIHQGPDYWLRIKSDKKVLPLWLQITIIVVCLCFSCLFSGLNLGLMAMDQTELQILIKTGNKSERKYAKAIAPVRATGNYLLCSILLANVLVNSIFTIYLDDLTSGLIAIIFSTICIVIMGEIVPQAVCSRFGLFIGAKTIYITKLVMFVTFPLSYSIAKLLDFLLGKEIGNVYTRERLQELVKLQVVTGKNDLDNDEVNIISGALELRKKTVAEVMTKIEDVFMLKYDSVLDFETVSEIMKSGYSRVPVYEGNRKNIVTMLYTKDLAFVDPDDNTPLKTLCQFYQNPCNFVFDDTTLDVMFKIFKEGNKGHMAFVQRINNEGEGDPFYETIGIITMEDVIEELIQAEIMDETDVYTDNKTKRRRNADRTKPDFSIFADRKHESSGKHTISPQLTLAAFQYLSTSVAPFKTDCISETILLRLLKQDIYLVIKKSKDWKNDPSTLIYQQGKPADYFVLILEGRVEVTVGSENLLFESGPFTFFGTQALMQNVGGGIVEHSMGDPSGSIQSLNMDALIKVTFQPDYSVRACSEVLYIKVRRSLYLAAKRATLMERSQKDTVNSNEQFDDEVEKLFESFKDDASLGRRSPDVHQRKMSHRLSTGPTGKTTDSPKTLSPTYTSNHLSPARNMNGPSHRREQTGPGTGTGTTPSRQQNTAEKEEEEKVSLLTTV